MSAKSNSSKKQATLGGFLLLFVAIGIYSCSSLCSKLASGHPFLSLEFIFFYGLSIFILVVYAVLWQQVLKRFDLSLAYACKPFSMILSMVWGITIFHETLTWNMIVGTVIILIGMQVVMREHGK